MQTHRKSASAIAVEWHAYIHSAPTFAESQDRMQQAVVANVDFADLLTAQDVDAPMPAPQPQGRAS